MCVDSKKLFSYFTRQASTKKPARERESGVGMVNALGGQEQRWCQRERARQRAGLCQGVCVGVVDQAMTRSNRGEGQGRKGG